MMRTKESGNTKFFGKCQFQFLLQNNSTCQSPETEIKVGGHGVSCLELVRTRSRYREMAVVVVAMVELIVMNNIHILMYRYLI